MTKSTIETFLLSRQGYLKKSFTEVAKAIWKNSPKHTKPKTSKELEKELKLIKEVQSNLRKAKAIETEVVDNQIVDIYKKIIDFKNKPVKTLLFDLETSPNQVFSWRIGNKINLSHDNIITERAVICIGFKWLGEDKVSSLEWNKGCDKEMLTKFAKIIDSADIIIGQNSDKFDIKWLRTRCLYHNIPISPKFNSIDTLKMARQGFNFNSNKLDYLSKFIGNTGKTGTTYDLWRDICLHNSKEAMKTMIDYCKNDIIILEQVYNKLKPYCPEKRYKYVLK